MRCADGLRQVRQKSPGLFGGEATEDGPSICQTSGREVLDRSKARLSVDVPVE